MAKKWYVIDTSVYLSDSDCLARFGNNDIIVPLKVLEEIDKHKKRQDSVGFHARQIIKTFDSLRLQGNHSTLPFDGRGNLRQHATTQRKRKINFGKNRDLRIW